RLMSSKATVPLRYVCRTPSATITGAIDPCPGNMPSASWSPLGRRPGGRRTTTGRLGPLPVPEIPFLLRARPGLVLNGNSCASARHTGRAVATICFQKGLPTFAEHVGTAGTGVPRERLARNAKTVPHSLIPRPPSKASTRKVSKKRCQTPFSEGERKKGVRHLFP